MTQHNIKKVSRPSLLNGYVAIMRPKQWIKNVFVLAPLFFSREFLQWQAIVDTLVAMVIFCCASSIIYIINDIQDMPADKRHPEKSVTRPLASGAISIKQALSLLVIIFLAMMVGFYFEPRVIGVIALYLLVNIAYTYHLKYVPVVDIFCIALGFVLRVYAGAMVLWVPVSTWMLITTLCLALYLACIKRKQELSHVGSGGREVLSHYPPELIDKYAEISALGALIFYSMFVVTTKQALVWTIPLVIFGLFRYWYLVEAKGSGENPTEVAFNDRPLQVIVLAWGAICVYVLWP